MAVTNEDIVYKYQQAGVVGDTEEKNRIAEILVENNIGLIMEVSSGYRNIYAKNEADKEDIISEAKVAFIFAAESFDPSKTGCFSTWAWNQINFALVDYVRKNGLIHIPTDLQRLIKIHDEIIETYKKQHQGETPSDKMILIEMNKKVKVTKERLNDIKAGKAATQFVSFDSTVNEDGNSYLEILDRLDFTMVVESAEEKAVERCMNNNMQKAIYKLPELEKKVIFWVYFENMKQTEVATMLGKRKQDINKILNRAYKHLMQMPELKNNEHDEKQSSGK